MSMEEATLEAWADAYDFAGGTATYTAQGVPDTVINDLPVVPGQTETSIEYEDGTTGADKLVDFLVRVSDMSGTVPSIGDTILWAGDTYEVRPTVGERWYESWRYNNVYRIHTKLS